MRVGTEERTLALGWSHGALGLRTFLAITRVAPRARRCAKWSPQNDVRGMFCPHGLCDTEVRIVTAFVWCAHESYAPAVPSHLHFSGYDYAAHLLKDAGLSRSRPTSVVRRRSVARPQDPSRPLKDSRSDLSVRVVWMCNKNAFRERVAWPTRPSEGPHGKRVLA